MGVDQHRAVDRVHAGIRVLESGEGFPFFSGRTALQYPGIAADYLRQFDIGIDLQSCVVTNGDSGGIVTPTFTATEFPVDWEFE